MDHVIRIVNRHGCPEYSYIYLLFEKPLSPSTRYSLTHLLSDIMCSGFQEPIVYELNLGDYVKSLLFIRDVIKNIEQDVFIVLGSDNTLLDSLLLLSIIMSRKDFQLIALHGSNAIHLTDTTTSILLNRAKIPGGALRILEYIRLNENVHIKDIVNELGYNTQTIQRYLYILKKYNLVKCSRSGWVKATYLARAVNHR